MAASPPRSVLNYSHWEDHISDNGSNSISGHSTSNQHQRQQPQDRPVVTISASANDDATAGGDSQPRQSDCSSHSQAAGLLLTTSATQHNGSNDTSNQDEHSPLLKDSDDWDWDNHASPNSVLNLNVPLADVQCPSFTTLVNDTSDCGRSECESCLRHDEQENEKWYKRWRRTSRWHIPKVEGARSDILVVLLSLFIAEASRGLVVPTIYSYVTLNGGSVSTLGTLISLFSLGRLLAAVPFGHIADRTSSSRPIFIFASILSCLSNTLYAFAWALPRPIIWLYISRFLVGFASGTVALCRAYMATGVEVRLRTRVIAWSGMAQYAGFSLTPGVATLIMWLGNVVVSATANKDESDTLPPEGSGPNLFDCVFPTAFLVITNLALIPVLLAYVPKKDPTPNTTAGSTAAPTHHHKRPKGKEPKVKDKQPTPAQTTRLLRYAFPLYLLLNLVLRGQIGITETLAPEMYQIHYQSDPNALAHSGRFFFILGLLGLGSFLSVERLQRVIPGWLVMEGGIAVLVLGVVMVIDPTPVPNEFNRILFYVGTFLVWSVASPICQTLTISLFSTMMGGRKQAGAIGWITTMGSVGRVVGPGMVGIAGGWWANVGGIIGGAICFVGVAMFEFYRRKVMKWKESDEERGLLSEDEDPGYEEIVWEDGHGCVDVEGCEGGVVDVEGGWRWDGDETEDAGEGEEPLIRKDDGTSSPSVVR